ncbi:MAG: TonB-dependent receptor [Muribaculaceae bacterium]|nr:TonB-dependent receptor [Muribaculaceae bacterium]
MTRKAWLALSMVLCLTFPALAQKTTVTGTVVDPVGEPLIGASVIAEGTTSGVATDFDGNFTIDVAPDATLVVSYVGYNTQRVLVEGRSHIDVTMSENAVLLNEVVAIGYGVVKKSDATGSVAVIKPDDIEAGISTSTQELLVGAAPGVVVTTNGGDPKGNGAIRIRGGASLNASNDPLIVIDGVPQTNQGANGVNALSMVNPQSIESMTILKDASATAIYGSRASNGVIIITTKKGQSGKPQVNFAANWHVNTPRNYMNMMSTEDFRDLVMNQIGTEQAIGMLGDADTDWQREVLRTSFSQDYNLSVGGQAKWLPYRFSAGYTNNQGIIDTSSMQRVNVGINLSPKFFDGLLQINANVQGSYFYNQDADGVVGAASRMNPTLPVYQNYATVGDAGMTMYNGYYNNLTSAGIYNTKTAQNPVQNLMDKHNVNKSASSTGNLQIDYALHWLPELHFNLNLGYQVSKNDRQTEIAPNSVMAWGNTGLITNGTPGAGTADIWYELQRNTMLDFYVNYRNEFEAIKSNLDVMVGYSWQRFDYHGRSNYMTSTMGFLSNNGNPIFDGNQFTLSWDESTASKIGKNVNDAPTSRWAQKLQLISFFGRLNYSFDDTYLLTVTLRDDATSRFSKETRWGLFPSVALGWKINNMEFMEGTESWLNDFKLRLGWGVTGQQDVGSFFPYLPYYTLSHSQGFWYPSPDGSGEWIEPLYPEAYDQAIKWEETTTWNAGIDMAFLNNRVTFAFDWYLRNTEDLLAEIIATGWSTKDKILTNIGSLRNMGVEATIGAKPVVTKDFTWSTSYNVGWNRNKITKLTGNSSTDQVPSVGVPTGTGGTLAWHIVGQPANSYRVYQQVYDEAGDPIAGQYVDQNADGTIDDKDLILYHSPEPKVTMTWNNTFNYKKWDFGFSLRANIGSWTYNANMYEASRLNAVSGEQLSNLMADTFIFPTSDENTALSSYFIQNTSFVRCDNITLGYTWDKLLNETLNLRLYGAVQNPFVITNYKGLDPETYQDGGAVDNSAYPRPVTVSLGVVATF